MWVWDKTRDLQFRLSLTAACWIWSWHQTYSLSDSLPVVWRKPLSTQVSRGSLPSDLDFLFARSKVLKSNRGPRQEAIIRHIWVFLWRRFMWLRMSATTSDSICFCLILFKSQHHRRELRLYHIKPSSGNWYCCWCFDLMAMDEKIANCHYRLTFVT